MKKWICILSSFLILFTVRAQDPAFTQNLFHTLYMNPAFTGLGYKLKANVSYRNQWRYDNYPAYRTLYASLDAKVLCFSNGSYLAAGGLLVFDQEYLGQVRNTIGGLSLASSLKLTHSPGFEARLCLGLSVGLISRNYSITDEVLFETIVLNGSNFDPVYNGGPGRKMGEDIGAGSALQFSFGNRHILLIGAAGSHLTSPVLYSDERINRKYTASILYGGTFSERLDFRVFADAAIQGQSLRTQGGFLIGMATDLEDSDRRNDLGVSGGMSTSVVRDEYRPMAVESVSPVLLISYQFTDLILSKDINITTRSVAQNRGGMEFTLRFKVGESRIRSKEKLPRLCNEPCPLP